MQMAAPGWRAVPVEPEEPGREILLHAHAWPPVRPRPPCPFHPRALYFPLGHSGALSVTSCEPGNKLNRSPRVTRNGASDPHACRHRRGVERSAQPSADSLRELGSPRGLSACLVPGRAARRVLLARRRDRACVPPPPFLPVSPSDPPHLVASGQLRR